jgi:hypothetical protein
MYLIPCIECGSKPHSVLECPRFEVSDKPQKWNSEIDLLGSFPVKGFAGVRLRLRMLKRWSITVPSKNRNHSQITSDPKEFGEIDVISMHTGDVNSWCAILKIKVENEAEARKKLKRKFTSFGKKRIDVFSSQINMYHPYRCSKYPQNNQKALLHTANISVDWNDVYSLYGQPCPESGCNGKIEQHMGG